MPYLCQPEIVSAIVAKGFEEPMPALALRWNPDAPGVADRAWHLPNHLCITGPAPERFGCAIERHGHDAFHVQLIWNRMVLSWSDLTRRQILTTALAQILPALGTDLCQLLDQPIQTEMVPHLLVA